MLKMPNRNGWMVSWFTGEEKTLRYKNPNIPPKVIRMKDSYESTDKSAVIRKKKELEKAGFEIEMFTECIF